MTDTKSLFIEKEGGRLNVLMHFSVHRAGPVGGVITLVGSDSFRDPKTNVGYRTMKGMIGFVQIHSQGCSWRYLGDSCDWRHKGGFKSFDGVKKFAVNKFIQVVRSYLKTERYTLAKLTREEAKQIRAYLRKGIEELMKE